MNAQLHFSQIEIEQEITSKIQQITVELAQLREAGEFPIELTGSTLFYLEALGYMVDFATGMVTRETDSACQASSTPVTA